MLGRKDSNRLCLEYLSCFPIIAEHLCPQVPTSERALIESFTTSLTAPLIRAFQQAVHRFIARKRNINRRRMGLPSPAFCIVSSSTLSHLAYRSPLHLLGVSNPHISRNFVINSAPTFRHLLAIHLQCINKLRVFTIS